MTEAEAIRWLTERHVSRETSRQLQTFVDLLTASAGKQNLVSAASLQHIWARHIVDSAQLLALAGPGRWLDVGAGAGMPGIVIAILGSRPVTLVEPRRQRAVFLQAVAEATGITGSVNVVSSHVESMSDPDGYDIISARAFAPLPRLFALAKHMSNPVTRWILPKGRSASSEVAAARAAWHGNFELIPSVTDPEAAIVVASGIRRRTRR